MSKNSRPTPRQEKAAMLRTTAVISVGLVLLGAIVIVLSLSGGKSTGRLMEFTPVPQPWPTLPLMTAVPYSLPEGKVCTGEIIMPVDAPMPVRAPNFDIAFEVSALSEGPEPFVILNDGLILHVGDGVPDRNGNIVGTVKAIDDAGLHFCQIKDK